MDQSDILLHVEDGSKFSQGGSSLSYRSGSKILIQNTPRSLFQAFKIIGGNEITNDVYTRWCYDLKYLELQSLAIFWILWRDHYPQ